MSGRERRAISSQHQRDHEHSGCEGVPPPIRAGTARGFETQRDAQIQAFGYAAFLCFCSLL